MFKNFNQNKLMIYINNNNYAQSFYHHQLGVNQFRPSHQIGLIIY